MPRTKTTDKYQYILEYIDEAIDARRELKSLSERTMMAWRGIPFVNKYKQGLQDYGSTLTNPKKKASFTSYCNSIEEKGSMVVFNATETLVSMAMGGAGQFQYGPYDKEMDKDPRLVDKLSKLGEFFYQDNKIESLMPQVVRQMAHQGAGYLHIKPDGNRFILSLIDSYKMLNDPYRNKTNRSRYRGHTQWESWTDVKEFLKEEKRGLVLKSMNETEAYLQEVARAIEGDPTDEMNYCGEIDLDIFYGADRAEAMQFNEAHKKSDLKYAYQGDDVEATYIYDLIEDVYFVVINRKFIVKAQTKALSKKIQLEYVDSKGKVKQKKGEAGKKEVMVHDPYVEIPFIKTSFQTYPVSPFFYVLDTFDSVCSMETVMNHNLSIMAPISFLGTSYDADVISRAVQCAGEMIEGTLNQTGVFNKAHDMSPVVTAIGRAEELIKRVVGATDQFDLSAMIGDRAKAAEVSSANGAVSQRMNPILANITDGMSELMDKLFKMYVIFGCDDEFSFTYNGKYDKVCKSDMAGDCLIRAKLKSVIKVENAEQARNAGQVLGFLIGQEGIDVQKVVSDMVPIMTQDLVGRERAEEYVLPEFRDSPAKRVHQAKEAARKAIDPTADIDFSQVDPSQIAGLNPSPIPAGAVPALPGGAPLSQLPTGPAGRPVTQGANIPGGQAGAPGTNPDVAGDLFNQGIV